jgi:hypothetical protein
MEDELPMLPRQVMELKSRSRGEVNTAEEEEKNEGMKEGEEEVEEERQTYNQIRRLRRKSSRSMRGCWRWISGTHKAATEAFQRSLLGHPINHSFSFSLSHSHRPWVGA